MFITREMQVLRLKIYFSVEVFRVTCLSEMETTLHKHSHLCEHAGVQNCCHATQGTQSLSVPRVCVCVVN